MQTRVASRQHPVAGPLLSGLLLCLGLSGWLGAGLHPWIPDSPTRSPKSNAPRWAVTEPLEAGLAPLSPPRRNRFRSAQAALELSSAPDVPVLLPAPLHLCRLAARATQQRARARSPLTRRSCGQPAARAPPPTSLRA